VYLRQTKRKNKDGTVAHYLQLAHNVRDPDTGVVKAKILHSFGRAEHLEREALERLIASIARYLDQDPPLLASSASSSSQLSLGSGEVEALDARDLGGAWVLDQLWRRLGIDTAVKKVAKGRKLDAARLERVLFALVASRAVAPSSKLEVTRWVTDDVHINGLDGLDADQCYRAMDFLLEALAALQETGAERLRGSDAEVVAARSRQGRFRKVDEHLEVKDIIVGDGPSRQRFVMVRNLQQAERDAHTRERLVTLLEARIDGSDALDADARAELRGRIREKPGLWRYLRVTTSGLLRIDRAKLAAEAKTDGRTLLRTSDLTMDAADVARGYKALQEVERGFRDLKQLDLRPVYHRRRDRIVAHVQLCWLALLLIRTVEIQTGDTWRNISHTLDTIRLVTLATDAGTVTQRTRLGEKHLSILAALDLPEPARYHNLRPQNG
jgi:hypothetical protein